MIFNPYHLESLNELPIKEDKPVLTIDQIEKLELCRDWLQDVSYSNEYMNSACDTRQLDYAIANIEAVLKEYQPCDYTHLLPPQSKRPSITNRLRSLVLEASVHILKASFISIVLCGLGTVFCYGVDRIEQSRGEEYQPTWKQQAKVFEGSAICSISLCLSSVVIGACLSGGEQDERLATCSLRDAFNSEQNLQY